MSLTVINLKIAHDFVTTDPQTDARGKIYMLELWFLCMTPCLNVIYLRNEFNFWNVHGIMNTLGLVQSK